MLAGLEGLMSDKQFEEGGNQRVLLLREEEIRGAAAAFVMAQSSEISGENREVWAMAAYSAAKEALLGCHDSESHIGMFWEGKKAKAVSDAATRFAVKHFKAAKKVWVAEREKRLEKQA
jgi:hypothetical protein